MVRLYNPLDKERNLITKLIYFVNVPSKTSQIISTEVLEVVQKYKIVSLSADNTNDNFGGLKRKKGQNVYASLQCTLGKSILGVGSVAYIVRKCSYSSEFIPI